MGSTLHGHVSMMSHIRIASTGKKYLIIHIVHITSFQHLLKIVVFDRKKQQQKTILCDEVLGNTLFRFIIAVTWISFEPMVFPVSTKFGIRMI